MELVIEGNVFFEGRARKLALGIENGAIVEIKKVIKGVHTLDFGDRLIMPGAVDAHVHFREPGMTHKEDFLTGTTSAACGGVTAVLDMPNTKPSTATPADFNEKLSLVRRKACVDFGLFAGLTGKGRPERLAPQAAGYKLYMGSTTGDLLVDDYSRLPEILGPLASTGRTVAVHAEDEGLLRRLGAAPTDLPAYNDARPPQCESDAVGKFLGALGKNRGHICHISTRGALERLGEPDAGPVPGKGAGEAVKGPGAIWPAAPGRATCEVTPHHLLLDAQEDRALGTLGKMNPPLRKRGEREALWSAFLDGRIDALASDHAPHLEEEKDSAFADAPAGVPGTETMVPLMMMLVRAGRLPIERLVDAICTRPAEIYSLEAGRIAPGMPANLAVFDLHEVRPIRGKRLSSKCAWTPFEGREAVFPRAVFVRGLPAVEDWEATVSPGWGRFLAERAGPASVWEA
jgi:dihydroorotase